MQHCISFVNEQLRWEQESRHRHECHDPPRTAGMDFLDDRSPPRRLPAVARSDPWRRFPAGMLFPGDASRRRRLPWVVGSDRWNNTRGKDCQPRYLRGEDCHSEQEIYALVVKFQLSSPGNNPRKDMRMPKTAAVVQLPEILRNKSSHLVKLAGKIDSFSLLLREAPEGELKRSIEEQFHAMVFATRKEIRRYCPRYRSLPGEGILDFNTDCASGQFEPGDIGNAPPPKRGRLCETCCFFAGTPEEQVPEMTLTLAPQDLVLVV